MRLTKVAGGASGAQVADSGGLDPAIARVGDLKFLWD